MVQTSWKLKVRYVEPALTVGVMLGALWVVCLRGLFGLVSAGHFIGWLCAVFLVSTVAVVMVGGLIAKSVREAGVMGAGLIGICMALVLLAGGQMHLGWGDCVGVVLVYAAWAFLWLVIAWSLRGVMGGRLMGVELLAAMLLFAAPVTMMPVVRGLSGKAQEGAVTVIGYSSPLLGAIDGMHEWMESSGGGAQGWTERPLMYHLTSLGQDMAGPTPRWWVSMIVYGGVGAMVMAVRWWLGRQR